MVPRDDLLNAIEIELDYYTGLKYRISLKQLYYCVRRDIDLGNMLFKEFSRRVRRYANANLFEWENIINFDPVYKVATFSGPSQFIRKSAGQYVPNAWKAQDERLYCIADFDVSGVAIEVCRRNAVSCLTIRTADDVNLNRVAAWVSGKSGKRMVVYAGSLLNPADMAGRLRSKAFVSVMDAHAKLPCAALCPEMLGSRIESVILDHVTDAKAYNSAFDRWTKDKAKLGQIGDLYHRIRVKSEPVKTEKISDNDLA